MIAPQNPSLWLSGIIDTLQKGQIFNDSTASESQFLVKDIKKKPSLLLHSCCGPCSSYVLTYLASFFDITVLFYNPNISPQTEFEKRLAEQLKLISILNQQNSNFAIKSLVPKYDSNEFFTAVSGLENEKEGGDRCTICYNLRLESTARLASMGHFDFFCTTLSVSPHKNASKLNDIGLTLSQKFDIKYLFSDFKKKDGYKQSIILSKKYELYRQNWCGCIFSLPKNI